MAQARAPSDTGKCMCPYLVECKGVRTFATRSDADQETYLLAENSSVPVRFPKDFADSVMNTSHAKHNDEVVFDPFAAGIRCRRGTVAAVNGNQVLENASDGEADVEQVSESESCGRSGIS